MFVVESRERGHVVRVGDEVALGVAQVRAIEPHVTLIEDSVDHHESALSVDGCGHREVTSIQQRTVAGREKGMGLPMSGHVHLGPLGVVGVQAHARAQGVVGRDRDLPCTGQIEAESNGFSGATLGFGTHVMKP